MLSAKELYDILVRAYGEPGWWSDDPYTVMLQSVLVQNTTWRSVERAYENIGRLSPDDVMSMPADELQKLVRPCGFCRRKSATIISLTEWFRDRASTGVLSEIPTGTLRDELMSIRGVGRETADVILVYALRRPVFVVDAYTRRLMRRLEYGFGDDRDISSFFESGLDLDVERLGGMHRLILEHGMARCGGKPSCDDCPLLAFCAEGSRGNLS